MKILLVVIFLASSICAQNTALASRPEAACGEFKTQFQIKTDPNPQLDQAAESGKALVYIIEDQKFKFARDITVRVGVDGSWVGATRGSSYLFFQLDPGEHHLCADWISDFVSSGRLVSLYGFTPEAGKVYFFRARTMASPRTGNDDSASLELDLINRDEGKLLVVSSPLSVSHPKK